MLKVVTSDKAEIEEQVTGLKKWVAQIKEYSGSIPALLKCDDSEPYRAIESRP
jgi:hypothetical protein